MSLQLYFAFVAACAVIMIVPGPNVTLIIANGLRYGTRPALLNIAGSQLGMAICCAVVAFGLASIIEAAGWLFDALRLAGAAYLVWLGIKLWRSAGSLARMEAAPPPRGGFFLQGFTVLMSNPKVLILFGALFPQFIDPARGYLWQVVLLGATAMLVAATSDTIYAVAVGRAGAALSRRRATLIGRASGVCMIGGGMWLALSRTR